MYDSFKGEAQLEDITGVEGLGTAQKTTEGLVVEVVDLYHLEIASDKVTYIK